MFLSGSIYNETHLLQPVVNGKFFNLNNLKKNYDFRCRRKLGSYPSK